MTAYRLRAVGYVAATIAVAAIFVAGTKTTTQSSFRKPLGTGTVGSEWRTPPPPVAADKSVGASREIAFGKLPLAFEANQGQTDRRVKFVSRGSGYSLFLTGDEAVLALNKRPQQSPGGGKAHSLPVSHFKTTSLLSPEAFAPEFLRMKLVGANPKAAVSGMDELPGRSNYLMGNDPSKWRTNVPTYAKVKYREVYAGVDLIYYGNQSELEYDFIVASGTDPKSIRLSFSGTDKLSIDGWGALVLRTKGGDVRFEPPVAYQEVGSEKHIVKAKYFSMADGTIGFAIGNYDRSKPLVIDPVLVYSTYLGGNDLDAGQSIAVDAAGNVYLTGYTFSTNFPLVNPIQSTSKAPYYHAFITKVNAAGTAIDYSTYLGGSLQDQGTGIAIDSAGNAYVTGATDSSDFPSTSTIGVSLSTNGGFACFVAKINSTGSALIYSTIIHGSADDPGNAIAVDSAGNAYVTGWTDSANFPIVNAIQPTNHGGGSDAFVAKLNASGSALVYSTHLGGTGADIGNGIAVDSAGNAYVTGGTSSIDFPVANAFQPTFGGVTANSAFVQELSNAFIHDAGCCINGDAFVAKINAAGSALVYSSYLGGNDLDEGFGIAVDSAGDAYVVGTTSSANFPTANAFQSGLGNVANAFVSKVNSSGSALVYSTYLGGSGGDGSNNPGTRSFYFDLGLGIALDPTGNAYATGLTTSLNFPTVSAIQTTNPLSGGQSFLTKIDSIGSALAYSTYVNGTARPRVTVDSVGDAYLTGIAGQAFTLVNPLQSVLGGGGSDAFVSKISPLTVLTFSPPSLKFPDQFVGTTSAPQSITLTNTGATPVSIGSTVITPLTGFDFGSFAQTNNCGATLAPGAQCTFQITFTTSFATTLTMSVLSLSDSAADSPQNLALFGKAIAPAVGLSPASVTFGNQVVGTASGPQGVTLTNTGTATLNITSIGVTGTNATDFSQTNNCGTSVAPGGSCTISVAFTPTAGGARSASVTIMDNAPSNPPGQAVPLSGVGTAPSVGLSPTTLTFGNQLVATASSSQGVILSNSGKAPVTITSIAITGANGVDFSQTNTCGTSLATGGNCSINVIFTPAVAGSRAGTLNFTLDGASSLQTVALSGNGTDFSLGPAPGAPTSSTFTAGQSATLNLQVNPLSGFTGSASLSCSGAPTQSSCTPSASSVNVSGASPAPFNITVTTTARGLLPPGPLRRPWPRTPFLPLPYTILALLCALAAALKALRLDRAGLVRKWATSAAFMVSLAALMTLSGCGGGGSSGPPPPTGTPAGTYTLTVTGTSQGQNRTVALTLTVN